MRMKLPKFCDPRNEIAIERRKNDPRRIRDRANNSRIAPLKFGRCHPDPDTSVDEK